MKYLAAALILLAMIATWKLSTSGGATDGSTHELGLRQHKQLEEQVQELIRAAIKEKRPAVSDVTFQQIFTETIKPNAEIKARFRYSIVEAAASQVIEGTATLISRDGGQNWNWASENLKSTGLDFQDGSVVGPDASDPQARDSNPSSTSSAPAPEAPHAREGEHHP